MPPQLAEDLTAVLGKGVAVYAVSEDAAERGLPESGWLHGVERVSRKHVPELIGEFDRVLHW